MSDKAGTSMEHSQILPNLYVGSYPKTADEIGQLRSVGITGVLNLQTQEDFDYHGVDWPAIRAVYFARGIEVRRVPIRDFDDDDLRDRLPEAVSVLTELLDGGCTTYVHCNVGMNRSPSTVISYLHWSLGWSLEDAERHVRKCRVCAPVMEVIRLATRDRQGRLGGFE
jgi:protein-tyrosine phosphatase